MFLTRSSASLTQNARRLRRAIVERVSMSDDLTDDDFPALAAASFRALDEEEDAPSGAR